MVATHATTTSQTGRLIPRNDAKKLKPRPHSFGSGLLPLPHQQSSQAYNLGVPEVLAASEGVRPCHRCKSVAVNHVNKWARTMTICECGGGLLHFRDEDMMEIKDWNGNGMGMELLIAFWMAKHSFQALL